MGLLIFHNFSLGWMVIDGLFILKVLLTQPMGHLLLVLHFMAIFWKIKIGSDIEE